MFTWHSYHPESDTSAFWYYYIIDHGPREGSLSVLVAGSVTVMERVHLLRAGARVTETLWSVLKTN